MAKIFNLPLPRVAPVEFKAKPGRPFGSPVSQKQLNALRKHGIVPGAVLNPYGCKGYTYDGKRRNWWKAHEDSYRPEAMKRNRVVLEHKKAVALELHEIQQMARENATLAMETLVEISKNKRAPEATRIAASVSILDRAYGKASQTTISANITNGKASDITGDELQKRINHTLKRVEALTTRAPEAGKSEKRPADLRKLN